MHKAYMLFIALLLFCNASFSQNVWVNTEALQSIAQSENERFLKEKEEALELAGRYGWPVSFVAEDSTEYELIRVEEGAPVYFQTLNVDAAISTSTNHVWPGGRSGFNLNGAGMTMREWDGGGTRITHQEFGSRVVQVDNPSGLSNHATHVAGTMVAAGVNSNAKGMAYAANLRAFDWNNDNSEMASEAALGALVSQHSYGQIAGWANGSWSGTQGWHWFGTPSISQNEDWKFGFYNDKASTWDNISANAPYYLIVKSAGNNRGQGITSGTHRVWNNGWQTSTTPRELSGGTDGYDCIPTYGTAKNILTVGAVFDVVNGYSQPSDVAMTTFSSWGPTDDGRIKPDIVGNGVGVFSSYAGNNSQYASISGTSMSGPNVAGSLLLLQQLHDSIFNTPMRSASLRGLAIHTADECGPNLGPDYMFGWGLLNTEKAAELIADSVSSMILEEGISQAQSYTYTFYSDGVTPVKATLCWTDPSASVNQPSLNPTNIKLVNDLDVRITMPTDTTVNELPWILNPAIPSAAATKGDNIRDNVEVIDAGVLPAGIYEVTVTHKGTLQTGPFPGNQQPFSLILSGVFLPTCTGTSLTVDIDVLQGIICEGDSSAILYAFAENGTPPYNVVWNSQATLTTDTLTGVSAGTYVVEVTDALNCTASDTVVITEPSALIVQAQASAHVSCVENEDGKATFGVSGGVPPYAISASPTVTIIGDSIINLSAGVYTLTITDSLGCSVSDTFSINGPSDTLESHIKYVNDVSCIGAEDGAAAVEGVGGTPPYTYQWSTTPTSSADSIVDLLPGIYYVTITDANGCLTQDSVVISQPTDTLSVQAVSIYQPTCHGAADASAVVGATGGQLPYTYSWNTNPPQSGDSIFGLTSGTYTVTVVDANDCEAQTTVTITQPLRVNASVMGVQDESCRGAEDGVIDVNVSGGVPPFTYVWSNGGTTSTLLNLPAGTYNLTVTDANGCTDTLSATIHPADAFPLSALSGPDTSAPSQVNTYSTDSIFAAQYDWQVVGGSILSGQSTPSISVEWNLPGINMVSVVVSRGDTCEEVQMDVAVDQSFSVSKEQSAGFRIYPNPTTGVFRVTFSDVDYISTILIYDNLGRLVLAMPEASVSLEHEIDMSSFANGLYTIRVGAVTHRLILSK